MVELECAFGIDGGTYRLQDPAHPGCSDSFCNPATLVDADGRAFDDRTSGESRWLACGFMGAPATAWSPSDLKLLLQMHSQRGATYRRPGWHAGYNEVVLSAEKVKQALPRSILAFFVMGAHRPVFKLNDPYSHMVDMVEAHRNFLAAYAPLTSEQVPLLTFDPSDWDAPFAAFDGRRS